MSTEAERKESRTVEGLVSSDAMDKTIIVTTTRLVKHPVVHKYVKRQTRYYAHDEKNQCKIGDKVLIRECRPLSKTKRWNLAEVLETQK